MAAHAPSTPHRAAGLARQSCTVPTVLHLCHLQVLQPAQSGTECARWLACPWSAVLAAGLARQSWYALCLSHPPDVPQSRASLASICWSLAGSARPFRTCTSASEQRRPACRLAVFGIAFLIAFACQLENTFTRKFHYEMKDNLPKWLIWFVIVTGEPANMKPLRLH